VQSWSNPPEIRQKLGTRQKYFLPARQLSNPPELSKSGGENRQLATLGGETHYYSDASLLKGNKSKSTTMNDSQKVTNIRNDHQKDYACSSYF
jgi:hypothetical protein